MCIQRICDAFEKETLTKVRSNRHTIPELGKDIMKVLVEEDIFAPTSNRQHRSLLLNVEC